MILNIGNRKIGRHQPVFVIAEIGVNHEGDFNVCTEMVRHAAWAGADAIKLQTVDPDENYVKGTESWKLFRQCQLSKTETIKIFELTRELGMEPFTTSPDIKTLDWIDKSNVNIHKISSGMMTNDLIIKKSCETNKNILISTGMGTIEQIDHAVDIAKSSGNPKIALFQCTSEYPAPLENLNLFSIEWMRERYNLPIGFSDHSKGITAAIVATTLGAVMIEKHFSLDITRFSFDHRLSLDPDNFKMMVKGIRRAESLSFEQISLEIPEAKIMLGIGEKKISKTLQRVSSGNSRCLVARQHIKKGDVFTEENIGLKRPFPDNRGLEPYYYYKVLGKVAINNFEVDDPIREENIKGGIC